MEIGQRSEAAILAELVRRGYRVLVPFGFNHRYDLLIDLEGRFVRVQCKTGRLRRGAIVFRTMSMRANWGHCETRDYLGEADLFLVYCPETRGVYSIPVEEAPPGGHMYLRVEPTRNKQARGIRWASDYQLPE